MTPSVPEGVYKTKSAAKSWEAEAEHVFGVSNGGGGGNNRLDRIPHGRFPLATAAAGYEAVACGIP